ncbi:MAG TPA: APC family permease [Oleiagrimonas sp.]|nr:APC family permease [Oleiagrimonas sp.]
MSTTSNSGSAIEDGRLKRHIGLVGLLFASVGSIIGSGWLFGALAAAEQAGPASIISWMIGAVMILFIGLVYAELGTMFPLSGGVVRFPHFAFGSFASFISGWITWLAAVSTASIEVEAALQYAANYLPWLQVIEDGVPVLTTPGFFVACALLALFGVINLFGIRWFARINNALVWWKLAIILLVVVVFLVADFHPAHFGHTDFGGFAPLGWHGVFSAVATAGIVFSYLGFRQAVELAGETDNPQRNVPIAVIGSLAICAAIYIGLQVAFIGALPDSALANGWANIGTTFTGGLEGRAMAFGPLAVLAVTMGLTWLGILLYIDAFVSPADTGLIYATLSARLSYAMGRNSNAPKGLAKVNKRGVPWVGLIVSFFCGVIFFLPFPGWQKLVGFVTSATVLSFSSGPVTMMALRAELPKHERPFYLKGGWIIPYLAFFSSNLIVFWSGWDIVWKLMLMVVLGFVLLAVHEIGWGKHTTKLDFRSGWWVLPWLGGLTIISWLGRYPVLSEHMGNIGVLGLVEAVVVIALFSAFIMWLAHSQRLRGSAVHEKLAEKWD